MTKDLKAENIESDVCLMSDGLRGLIDVGEQGSVISTNLECSLFYEACVIVSDIHGYLCEIKETTEDSIRMLTVEIVPSDDCVEKCLSCPSFKKVVLYMDGGIVYERDILDTKEVSRSLSQSELGIKFRITQSFTSYLSGGGHQT